MDRIDQVEIEIAALGYYQSHLVDRMAKLSEKVWPARIAALRDRLAKTKEIYRERVTEEEIYWAE